MDTNFIKPLDSFVDEAIGYLPDYLKKDNLTKFLTVFLERLENLDTSFISLAEFRLLANAEDVVLDDIGEQMGIYRNGQSDEDYRTILLIRQSSAGKGGTRHHVSQSLEYLFGITNWKLYRGDNYRVDLYASSPCFDLSYLTDYLTDIFPIITHLRVVETDPETDSFGFFGDDSSSGFSSTNSRYSTDSGSLLKVNYTSDKAIHGHT